MVEIGIMPSSRSWRSSETFWNICSRTSFPRRVLEAVRVTSSEKTSFKSTTPDSLHFEKYISASMTN